MIIACATDSRFSELAGVMLASVVANGEIGDSRIAVFGSDLRQRDEERLRASCGDCRDQVEFFPIDAANPTLARLAALRPRVNPAFFYRLIIADSLADQNDRLLYLDCDMVVRASLRPLMSLALGDHVVAAVPDSDAMHPGKGKRFAYPLDAPYFNSGMMLIDPAKWRDSRMTEAFLGILDARGHELGWADQDALNIALLGRWLPLGLEWNVHEPVAAELGGYDKARIVHFTGSTKPFFAECTHPQRDLYLHYRELTPWRGRRLQSRLERRWRKSLGKRKKRLLDALSGLTGGSRPSAVSQQTRRNS